MAFTDQPKLDKTSRDRASILDDFIRPGGYLEQQFGAEFIDFRETEIGFAIIDLIASIGDVFNAAADQLANEAFLPTAREIQSVLDLARTLGYTPRGNIPSKWNLLLTTSHLPEILLTKNTVVLTNPSFGPQVEFEVEQDTTKPLNNTTVTIPVIAGRTINHPNFISDGSGIQTTTLIRPNVIDDSIIYRVDNIQWTQVDEFDSSNPNDLHFRVRVREDVPGERVIIIDTGDGQKGLIPPAGSTISISYRIGGGLLSNVPIGSIDTFEQQLVDNSGSIIELTLTNNTAATQLGQDQETKDEIRINAPVFIKTNQRVVSNIDHTNAVLTSGALRALTITNNESDIVFENTVLIFVATSLSSATPTSDATAIKSTLLSNFPGRNTRRLNVVPAQTLNFNYTIDVLIRNTESEAVVRPKIITALQSLFASDSIIGSPPRFVQDIGRKIYKSNIKRVIDQLIEVVSVNITQGDITPTKFQLPITDINNWTINITQET